MALLAHAARSVVAVTCVLAAALALNAPAPVCAQPAPRSEYEIKAAYLYNFARFVEWPSEAFSDSAAAIVFGVLGANPFGGALTRTLAGKDIDGRPVIIAAYRRAAQVDSCHVLFVGRSESEDLGRILQTLQGNPVLTVGEDVDFARRGGIIQFVLRDNKVRFEINLRAATAARLRMSAKLLRLATVVHDGN